MTWCGRPRMLSMVSADDRYLSEQRGRVDYWGIGQRDGLQTLVVSAKRSQAESIALLSSLGVAPRWAKTPCARSAKPAGPPDTRPADASASFSLMSQCPACPCNAWAHTSTTRNRHPATYAVSPRVTALRAMSMSKDASHKPATRASRRRGG